MREDRDRERKRIRALVIKARVLGQPVDLGWFSLACSYCGRLVERYDPDGIALCGGHWEEGIGEWEIGREIGRVVGVPARRKRFDGDRDASAP